MPDRRQFAGIPTSGVLEYGVLTGTRRGGGGGRGRCGSPRRNWAPIRRQPFPIVPGRGLNPIRFLSILSFQSHDRGAKFGGAVSPPNPGVHREEERVIPAHSTAADPNAGTGRGADLRLAGLPEFVTPDWLRENYHLMADAGSPSEEQRDNTRPQAVTACVFRMGRCNPPGRDRPPPGTYEDIGIEAGPPGVLPLTQWFCFFS